MSPRFYNGRSGQASFPSVVSHFRHYRECGVPARRVRELQRQDVGTQRWGFKCVYFYLILESIINAIRHKNNATLKIYLQLRQVRWSAATWQPGTLGSDSLSLSRLCKYGQSHVRFPVQLELGDCHLGICRFNYFPPDKSWSSRGLFVSICRNLYSPRDWYTLVVSLVFCYTMTMFQSWVFWAISYLMQQPHSATVINSRSKIKSGHPKSILVSPRNQCSRGCSLHKLSNPSDERVWGREKEFNVLPKYSLSSTPRCATAKREDGNLNLLPVPLTQSVIQGNFRFAVISTWAYRLVDVNSFGGPAWLVVDTIYVTGSLGVESCGPRLDIEFMQRTAPSI